MKLLNNIMSFDYYKVINEDLSGKSQRKSDEIFISKGKITLLSGETIEAKDIVNVVKEAINEIKMEWTSLYNFAKSATIFYTYNNPSCKTMYVTDTLEIHVSANFVHDNLKMDKELVMAILMHEIFHVVYDHIKRGQNWLSSYGKPLNAQTACDNNLAADIEVNATLVNKGIISYERLHNEARALFLKKKTDDLSTNYVNVVSMENILEDEEAMNKLRNMVDYPWPEDKKQNNQNDNTNQNGGDNGNQQGNRGEGGNEGNSSQNSNGNDNSSNENQPNKSSNGSKNVDGEKRELSGDRPNNIIGEFGDSNSKKSKDIFRNDNTYTDEEKKELEDIRKETSIRNSKSEIEKRKRDFVKSLSKNDAVRKIIENAALDSKKYEDLWKKILEKFLDNRHRPGFKNNSNTYDWKNKHRLANKSYGINIPKESESDPQDINVYVDVSGSMDGELISIICESLIIFCNKFKYTAINIIPWASYSGSIYKIDTVDKKGKDTITKKIIGVLENSWSECGGGTDAKATVDSIVKVCVESLMDVKKKSKDDVHIIITDGMISGLKTIENDIFNEVKESTKNKDIAKKALQNSIWMIYDASDLTKKEIDESIQVGKKIYISSNLVKKQNK